METVFDAPSLPKTRIHTSHETCVQALGCLHTIIAGDDYVLGYDFRRERNQFSVCAEKNYKRTTRVAVGQGKSRRRVAVGKGAATEQQQHYRDIPSGTPP